MIRDSLLSAQCALLIQARQSTDYVIQNTLEFSHRVLYIFRILSLGIEILVKNDTTRVKRKIEPAQLSLKALLLWQSDGGFLKVHSLRSDVSKDRFLSCFNETPCCHHDVVI